jgi:gluconolactonase
VEKLADGFRFVEGPVWNRSAAYLIFSDIPANAIMTWSPSGGASVFRARIFEGEYPDGAQVGTNGLTLDKRGLIVAAEHGNRQVSRIEHDGALTVLAERLRRQAAEQPE